jgi:hypothetical protein
MPNYIARHVVPMIAAMLALAACVAYVPPPVPPPPSTTERAYNAVVAAMAENGVRVGEANAATGMVTGTRGSITVTAIVAPRPDGSAQIEFRTKGNISEDPTLINRITESYNARMGR